MIGQRDFAYKLGCGRYIQQEGALELAGQEALRLHGTKAYVLGGPHTLPLVQERLFASLQQAGIPFEATCYDGACSEEKAAEFTARLTANGTDLLVGVGGGRMMDFAKLLASCMDVPLINIPTCAATCAAYTPLSVVYTAKGACRGSVFFRKEVDCVLCDMQLMAAQPRRLLAAGMVDAMAKWLEICHHRLRRVMAREDEATAMLLAKHIYDRLITDGAGMLDALGDPASPLLFDAVYLCIATTGLVSGAARGMYQSALAHALYESLRTHHTAACAAALHGEVVGVGLLAQLDFLDLENERQMLQAFMQAVQLPCTLADIGVTLDDVQIDLLSATGPALDYISGKAECARFAKGLRRIS